MGLYRRKDSDVYWISFTYNGKHYRRSTGTTDEKLSKKILSKIQTQIIEGKWFEKEGESKTSFGEIVERYMNKYARLRDPYTIKNLLPYFGNQLLSEIKVENVEDYIVTRLSEGAKEATVYQEFALGRRIFNIAYKKWRKDIYIRENPFSDAGFPTYDNSRDRWLNLEEEKKLLLAASPEWVKDIIIFAIHTGCRRGEILAINVRDIDMSRKILTVHASKGGNKKIIPISKILYQMLQKRLKVINISGKLFDVTAVALKDAFERALKKSGIENLHFHDLRHTFGTRLVQAGMDLYRVQKLMGHKSIKMTERYAHHSPESLRPASKALDSYYDFHDFVTLAEN